MKITEGNIYLVNNLSQLILVIPIHISVQLKW